MFKPWILWQHLLVPRQIISATEKAQYICFNGNKLQKDQDEINHYTDLMAGAVEF